MTTPEQYRAKAAKLSELANTAANPDDAHDLHRRQQSLTALADNAQWLNDHPNHTVHPADDVETDPSKQVVAVERWDDEGGQNQ